VLQESASSPQTQAPSSSPTSNKKKNPSIGAIVGGVVGGLVVLAVVVAVIVFILWRRRRERKPTGLVINARPQSPSNSATPQTSSSVIASTPTAQSSVQLAPISYQIPSGSGVIPSVEEAPLLPWKAPVIPFSELTFQQKLGSGAFGEVWKGACCVLSI
jgi:hypothetical protein